jgi:signal transduction histidine kinase
VRRALIGVALAVTSMVALAFLVPLGLLVQATADKGVYAAAERQAAELVPALAITTDRAALEKALASTRAGTDGTAAVRLPLAGDDWTSIGPARAAPAQLSEAIRAGRSSVVAVADGSALLQPVAVEGGRVAMIEVFMPGSAFGRGVVAAWLILGGVAVALVLLSVLVADRLGSRIVRTTRELATAARDLGTGDLDARALVRDPEAPAELREAAAAFNGMAEKIRRLLAAERELAADLSHRLRTPLTALRLNTAGLGDTDAAERTRQAVEQLEREVDQIIRAARSRGADQTVVLGCDPAEVVRERAGFWSALAEDQGRTWRLYGVRRATLVPVSRNDLALALDAVLGNVFRHTAEGAGFTIDVRSTNQAVRIRVSDGGSGFDDPTAALDRGTGSGGAGSTGLGLDIARRVAESTGGEVTVGRSRSGGAEVTLHLRTMLSVFSASRP